MTTFRRRIAAFALAPALLLAGCTTTGPSDPATSTSVATDDYAFPIDEVGDVTFAWTAADGIDLLSPEATIVRATDEAIAVAGFVGEQLSYPGLDEFWRDFNDQLRPVDRLRTLHSGVEQRRWAGTTDYHIYKLEWNGNELSAEYCVDDSYLATSADEGRSFRWLRSSITRVTTRKLTLARDTTDPPAPPPAPTGRRAPTWNAFDGWRAIDLFQSGDFDHCTTWYNTRDRDPDRPYWPQYSSRDPEHRPPPGPNPPIAPPTPGW
ncbi:hypothetical protein HT102_01220 [Hoyosella sp. G463]|uniref:Lipoprotein n=1 Tax=Lolliginicoccus lacisalsi TaxID=2742202 RepID=A0A927JA36_9ACTN|nr:hypothetical protein [Lolliginicoccus lacisalsi]MBD8505110.1 hypothetical protein [Lolliginicoccus lacisalsi]